MTKRKLILLATAGVLLAVCIIQGITGAINPVKTIKTDSDIDTLTIDFGGSTVKLAKLNGTWFVGDDDYAASKTDVESMIKNISEIKVLDKIGRLGNTYNDERYDLSDDTARIVTAYNGNSVVQKVRIGKASTTGSQTYAVVGNSSDISVISGNLVSVFNKTEEALRAKTVYTIEENAITGALVETDGAKWGLKKAESGSGWELTEVQTEQELDSDLAQSWIRNIAFMNVKDWAGDTVTLPAKATSTVTVYTATDSVTVSVYKTGSGDSAKIYGTCTRTPHIFELSDVLSEKFTKNYTDLLKK